MENLSDFDIHEAQERRRLAWDTLNANYSTDLRGNHDGRKVPGVGNWIDLADELDDILDDILGPNPVLGEE